MKYDYQTVSRTMLGDLHTPVSTYLKVRDIFSSKRTHGEFRLSWQ